MEIYKKQEIEFEDKIADQYNSWYHQTYMERQIDSDFTNYLKKFIKKGDKVLDLGCGPASLWYRFIKIKSIDLIGVDISPNMIGVAKKLYPNNKFKVGDTENIPFKDKTFDVVICSSVLHHLPKTNDSFKEIGRVLKSGGILVGREPQTDLFIPETNLFIREMFSICRRISGRKSVYLTHEEPPIHKYHHAYKVRDFASELFKYFDLKQIESKYPFSYSFTKIDSVKFSKIILKIDDCLKYYKGNQFFYNALNKKSEGKTEANIYLEKIVTQSEKIPWKFLFKLGGLTLIFLFTDGK